MKSLMISIRLEVFDKEILCPHTHSGENGNESTVTYKD